MTKRSKVIGTLILGLPLLCVTVVLLIAAWGTIKQVAPMLIFFFAGLVILIAGAWVADYFGRMHNQIKASNQETETAITLSEIDIQSALLELYRQQMRLLAEMGMLPLAMRQAAAGLMYPKNLAGMNFDAFPAMTARTVANQQAAIQPQNEALPPLLPALKNRQRILIVGASDSGKTTLMRHLIDIKKSPIVIDPHGTPPKWGRVPHVGKGRDFAAIGQALANLNAEMQRRYEEQAEDEMAEFRQEQNTIFIDEWRTIAKHVPGAGDCFGTLLTEARKTNMNVIVASHTKSVKGLGIEGEGDLRKGIMLVELHGGDGEYRHATASYSGRDPISYALPGPYHDRKFNKFLADSPQPFTIQIEPEPAPSILDGQVLDIEAQIVDAYVNGQPKNSCYRLYHKLTTGNEWPRPNGKWKRLGSQHTEFIDTILRKNGIEDI